MRSLPSMLRALMQAATVTAVPHERSELGSAQGAAFHAGPLEAVSGLGLERMEAMVRRYQGRPARIENPFAAFPTRSFWLSKLMDEPD